MSTTFARTGALLRFDARRDRVRGAVWVLAVFAFVPYVLTAYSTLLTGDEMASVLSMFSSPTMKLFTGPGFGLDGLTPDSDLAAQLIFAGAYWSYLLILVALMNIFLVSRHTRQDEQSGRAEIIRANPVGRDAPLTAALLWIMILNVVLGALMAGALIGFGSPVESSVLMGVATAAFGLFFAGLTAVTCQISAFSSAANGIAGGVLGAAYLVRGVGDMIAEPGEHGSTLSWFSPFAWAQQTRVYDDPRWWPVLLLVGAAAVLVAVAYLLQSRRDFGAGMIAVRRGKTRASSWIGSPLSVTLVLLRSQALWWMFSLGIAGLVYGSFTQSMVDVFSDMPVVFQQLMGGADGAISGYLTLTVVMMRVVVACYAVSAIGKLRTEEAEGRLEPLLATSFTPRTWLGNALGVVTVVVAIMVTGLGTIAGAFGTATDGDYDWVSKGLTAGAAGIPSVLMVLALAAALYSLSPRLLTLAWIPVVWGGIVSMFGGLLKLPDWARQFSPFEHTPEMPAQDFELTPFLVQCAVAVALGAFAVWRIWLRNLPTE